MIILGIDPGSITTGYAFLDKTGNDLKVLEYGVIHAPADHALEDRLLHIITELEKLLDRYHPNALSMEGVFFAKNAKSALVLGHIRGAVLVSCRKYGMTFNEYPPKVVKQAVTGNGAAPKEQVANMIFARLGISQGNLPLDASDALAIAWTHANPSPLSIALTGSASVKKTVGKKTVSLTSRKKKATTRQWMDLIEKMGGTIQ
ncbi:MULTISPECIES: crossover junction endodeoxyribonuclease RuvC [unclassified Fibrobacter]|uniref:crossover junction endodeoxyribonuclease RuvC n=1 Tax=unclassified Fibrobacter TaxID=2634177 RepID=UPI000D6B5500|nr:MULTISPECIES: crossover junction endodeoxyribonuclease RuvC [unclassified Fibrobacter]PWJ71780.1 Holliday junction endonuclease RuvC [Fibrobacter sp. UWR4]PZW73695.1 Holliday junction endonuclease RuvC [Fibrobacter sp. UWR1]